MKRIYLIFVLFILPFLKSIGQESSGLSYSGYNVRLDNLDFSRYPLIDLYVSVTDRNGDPVRLEKSILNNLRINQNVKPVNLDDINSVLDLKNKGESQLLYMTLVFDNSASMQNRIELLENAARLFIDSLQTGDYASIIDFADDDKTMKIPEFEDPLRTRLRIGFSNSKVFLKQSVATPNFTSKTIMYDALLYALSVLNNIDELGKKVIIFFSDGIDNSSSVGDDEIEKYAKEYNVPIYAIDLNSFENRRLKEIARNSGGEYFFVKEASSLTSLYQSILKLFKSQYRITYKTPDSDVSINNYRIDFSAPSLYPALLSKTFSVKGDNIAYYNIIYHETIGKENINEYIKFITSYPFSKWHDHVILKLGNYWLNKGELPKAMSLYNKILRNKQSAAFNQALSQKAGLLLKGKDFALAQKTYKELLNRSDAISRPKVMLDLAKSYAAEGNFATALEIYSNLISTYKGTEAASDALFQSGTINMEMGDLNKAISEFKAIVTDYVETKTAVFAKYELARIEEKRNNYALAEGYYEDILKGKIDAEMVENTKTSLADLYIKDKKFDKAIELLKNLASTKNNYVELKPINMKLHAAYMAAGRFNEARKIFESLESDAQKQLMQNAQLTSISSGSLFISSLPNGVQLISHSKAFSTPPIVLAEYPDLREKFSAVGPFYNIKLTSDDPADSVMNISVPLLKNWMEKNAIISGESGIFLYHNNYWEDVTDSFDEKDLSYTFDVKKSGIYALLSRKPKVVTLYNIYFDVDQASINKDSEKNLYQIIDELKNSPYINLEIAGHTDSTGTEEHNIELSSSRAEAVKAFMVMNGIDPSRLTARGFGSQYPVAQNNSEENMQKNRRTEFTVIYGTLDISRIDSTIMENDYTILLNEYNNLKDVYEMKKFLKNHGYDVSVITNEMNKENRYELIMGQYKSIEEAEKKMDQFASEYKSFNPVVKRF